MRTCGHPHTLRSSLSLANIQICSTAYSINRRLFSRHDPPGMQFDSKSNCFSGHVGDDDMWTSVPTHEVPAEDRDAWTPLGRAFFRLYLPKRKRDTLIHFWNRRAKIKDVRPCNWRGKLAKAKNKERNKETKKVKLTA